MCENRCLLADILDVENLPLQELCNHIRDDAFWQRMFKAKWPEQFDSIVGKPWVEIYIEKFLSETLENLKPSQYNVEKMKSLIELCSPFVKCLKINQLEAALDTNNHIPFDIVLEHLNELKVFSIAFNVRTIGTNFYLNCTSITNNDIAKFIQGLSHTDLKEFEFHSSKLDSKMLRQISRSLDKTSSLTKISLPSCRFGDDGLKAFVKGLTHDSFPHLKDIVLSNNFISPEGAIRLANILRRRKIDSIDIKLNPILAEGAIHLLAIATEIELKTLNFSSCSFDESISDALLFVLQYNKTLVDLNLSINKLSDDLGHKMIEAVHHNKVMKTLDIRNTEINLKTKSEIDAIILENREKHSKLN